MERKEYEEKVSKCLEFIQRVADLCNDYTLIGSCNKDLSRYLIPKGSESELTYYGKPGNSLRFSDHWNWFANIKKCSYEYYVQCRNLDMPWARLREEAGKPTKPRFGIQVAYYDSRDKSYHHVFGDKFDKKTKTWSWIDNADPNAIAEMLMAGV